MATYSSGQAYVGTTRYTANNASGSATIYTVPALRESEVEIQLLRVVSTVGDMRLKVVYASGRELYLLNVTGAGSNQFGYNSTFVGSTAGAPSERSDPFKITLLPGDSIQSQTTGLGSYTIEFTVKEFVKA